MSTANAAIAPVGEIRFGTKTETLESPRGGRVAAWTGAASEYLKQHGRTATGR